MLSQVELKTIKVKILQNMNIMYFFKKIFEKEVDKSLSETHLYFKHFPAA